MRKKKYLNIIAAMLIISNVSATLGTNIAYAEQNQSSSGTELNGDDNLTSDEDDNFNDGENDITYNGNDNYNFLNDDTTASYSNLPKPRMTRSLDDDISTQPGQPSPPESNENNEDNKDIDLGTIKLDLAIYDGHYSVFSKKSDIINKIKTFAEQKTGKKMRVQDSLWSLKYDEERNMPYYELIEKQNDDESDQFYYSYGRKINRVYVQSNYYYSTENVNNPNDYNINTLIENVKRNNPEITNIKILSTQSLPFGKTNEDDNDSDYEGSSYNRRYVLANVTKNGITNETKIIFDKSTPYGYHLFEINENDFKTRTLSEETKNKINKLLSKYNNNIYYDQHTYTLASDKLETDQNDFKLYIQVNVYDKDTNETELQKYVVAKPNFSENINVDDLKVNDNVFYFSDDDLDNLSYHYNDFYYQEQNNPYKLFLKNRNNKGISTFLEKLNENKPENEKISVYDILKINKDSDTYLILKLSNNELYTIKFSKFNFPNIKIDVNGNSLTDENRHQINKVLRSLFGDNIGYFKDLDVVNDNGKISLKFRSNFNDKDIESTIRLNKLNNENFEIINPENIPENNSENLAKLVETGNINEEDSSGTYNVATFDVNQNFDGYLNKPFLTRYNFIPLKTEIGYIIEDYAQEHIANKIGKKIYESQGYRHAVYHDKELNKFFMSFASGDGKEYRIYLNPIGKDYQFVDINENPLDLRNKKDIEKFKAFMKNEYKLKDIQIENENIMEDENGRKYIEAIVTKENGDIQKSKIYLPERNYVRVKALDLKNVNVSMEEFNNKKLTEETYQRINNELKELIKDNPLYSNQNVYLVDHTIYENQERHTIHSYMGDDIVGDPTGRMLYQIKVHDESSGKDYFINIKLTPNKTLDNFMKEYMDEINVSNLKLDNYSCSKENTNSGYLSNNGKLNILDYINLKINKSLYADNLRTLDINGKTYIIADLKDKTTKNIVDTYVIKPQYMDLIHNVFLENVDVDNLQLSTQNKNDLERIILHYFGNGIDKMEIDDNITKDKRNYLFVKINITLKDGSTLEHWINLFVNSKYQDDVIRFPNSKPSPSCPPSMARQLELPKYGKTCTQDLKITVPNIDDIPDGEVCIPNKPNEPDEPEKPIPNKPVIPTPNKPSEPVTPSNITPDPKPNGGGITPKPNKPSTPSTPNTTPSRPSEPTPVTVINKTENKNNVDESQLATTLPKQDVPQSEISRNIKTGDNMFNMGIIMMFSILGLAIYTGIQKFKTLNFKKRE